MNNPKIAIVHDWFVNHSGSEKVVEHILNVFPEADLFSLVDFLEDDERGYLKGKKSTTSFIQHLPFAKKHFRNYLPLFPIAIEQLDVSGYDIVISSSHAFSKGVITNANQLHICYCHSPMRYAWDLYHEYLFESGLKKPGVKSAFVRMVLHYLRLWDLSTSNRIDHFIANSHYIAKRIFKVYKREASVIYPPVEVDDFTLASEKEDYYLTASRLVPYKRIDLIVEAFNDMPDKQLYVIGDGTEMGKIQKIAGNNVKLLGYQPFSELKKYLQKAKAFVFAADEDFGIFPVEAQACGTPVIALNKGGTKETVIHDSTGILFPAQNVDALKNAVNLFDSATHAFDPSLIRQNAEKFHYREFQAQVKRCVMESWDKLNK